MMSDGFTKLKISLVLRVIHVCLIHSLKANIFVYLRMYVRNFPNLIVRKNDFKTCFFRFYFFIQDISLNIYNIHLQGTVSQNLKIGLSSLFMSKMSIFSLLFFKIS